jgi:hypothetical protein
MLHVEARDLRHGKMYVAPSQNRFPDAQRPRQTQMLVVATNPKHNNQYFFSFESLPNPSRDLHLSGQLTRRHQCFLL